MRRFLLLILATAMLLVSGCGSKPTASLIPATSPTATPAEMQLASPSPSPTHEGSAIIPANTPTPSPTLDVSREPTTEPTTSTLEQVTPTPGATAGRSTTTPHPSSATPTPTVARATATPKPPAATPTKMLSTAPATPTPTPTPVAGIGYATDFVYAPQSFIDNIFVGLNDARRDHGSAPMVLDRSGDFYKRAERQARLSAQAEALLHSVEQDGSESIARYPYFLDWSAGKGYGNQAAIHAPGLLSASHTKVGICVIAYKSNIYVVLYSSAWMF